MRSFTREAAPKKFRIGVVGYSSAYFDRKEGKKLIEKLVKKALRRNRSNAKVSIVSGLTKMGIPLIAYKYADENKYHTVGYACKEAEDFACYEVKEKHIVGDNWGDESEDFLDNIDVLIRIGGGKQSLEEVEKAKEKGIPVYEEELPQLISYCLMGNLCKKSQEMLHEQVSKMKAREIKEADSYHVTIRFWLKDKQDKNHINKVKRYLRQRFKYPVHLQVDFEGITEVLGDEDSYTLLVTSPTLIELQAEIDEKLQSLGAPPSDFPDYKAHITVAEGVTKKKKIKPCSFIIDRWFLTRGENAVDDSKLLWETDSPMKKVVAAKVVTSEHEFRATLDKAKDVDEILDFLVFQTPERTTDAAIFDHLLLLFFSGLPDFHGRQDIDEKEVEEFKREIPYEEYGLNRESMLEKLKNYRSVNRIIEEVIEEMSSEEKTELATEHLRKFWFEEKCNHDIAKFVTALKPSYWLRAE